MSAQEPSEADKLWEGLDLEPGEMVSGAMLIAKVTNFESGGTIVSFETAKGMDFIEQIGLLRAASIIVEPADGNGLRLQDDD